MDQLLSFLSTTVPQAKSLEQLTRPLLTLLGQVTGMESTYLTTIDLEQGVQRVEFARNDGDMEIPEGLQVPWEDTLCKRALDEGRAYTDDVSGCWGDSDAARALGIRTYVSAPIRAQDGRVLGTVCAASAMKVARNEQMEPMLSLLSGLLGYSLEREVLVDRLQVLNSELAQLALTDALTGLYNRRAILGEIPRLLAMARRERRFILVAVIDLDGFKQINDNHGHQSGDQFLSQIAERLKDCLRGSDVLGRTGGDEFVVCALGNLAGQGTLADWLPGCCKAGWRRPRWGAMHWPAARTSSTAAPVSGSWLCWRMASMQTRRSNSPTARCTGSSNCANERPRWFDCCAVILRIRRPEASHRGWPCSTGRCPVAITATTG